MKYFRLYLREARYLKWYIAAIVTAIVLSYSVYALLKTEKIADLGREDRFFEWMTAICFLVVSVLFGVLSFRRRNFFYLILSVMFLFGFGEEISWGQRILGFTTPDLLNQHNVQKEFNLHNIELLNRVTHEGEAKSGLRRILEVNLLFKIMTIIFAVATPLVVFHSRRASDFSGWIRLPVPPVTIAIFFVLNWLVFRIILDFALPVGKEFQYYDTNTEIFEFVSAFIILIIALIFYNKRRLLVPGRDIKQVI